MKKTGQKAGIFGGFFLLLFVVFVGVAMAGGNSHGDKVTICHAAGLDGTTHYNTLTIGYQAVYGPAGHFYENGTPRAGHEDDYLGSCYVEATTTTTTTVVTEETDPTTTTTTTEVTNETDPTTTTTTVVTDKTTTTTLVATVTPSTTTTVATDETTTTVATPETTTTSTDPVEQILPGTL